MPKWRNFAKSCHTATYLPTLAERNIDHQSLLKSTSDMNFTSIHFTSCQELRTKLSKCLSSDVEDQYKDWSHEVIIVILGQCDQIGRFIGVLATFKSLWQ